MYIRDDLSDCYMTLGGWLMSVRCNEHSIQYIMDLQSWVDAATPAPQVFHRLNTDIANEFFP